MTSYFSACDVTVANSNHKNVLVFLTCTYVWLHSGLSHVQPLNFTVSRQ